MSWLSSQPSLFGDSERVHVHLLGGLRVEVGGAVIELPTVSSRLVALVSLSAPYPVERTRLAGELWPSYSEKRAASNLRSTMWRLRSAHSGIIEPSGHSVSLSPRAWVDIANPLDVIRQHVAAAPSGALPELLSGWYEDWVVHERERIRQRFLHLVEAESDRERNDGRFAIAIDLAFLAIEIEPLRETAHRLLIEAHLQEGNPCEALRSYERYAELVRRELGVDPSDTLRRLAFAAVPKPAAPSAPRAAVVLK